MGIINVTFIKLAFARANNSVRRIFKKLMGTINGTVHEKRTRVRNAYI